tara:strand:- start:261 stop:434 length:174 start_codon:yes stop_codon:yes gene_type:complete
MDKKELKNRDKMIGLGLTFGILFGIIIDNVGLGICLGLCIGVGLGSIDNNKKEKIKS